MLNPLILWQEMYMMTNGRVWLQTRLHHLFSFSSAVSPPLPPPPILPSISSPKHPSSPHYHLCLSLLSPIFSPSLTPLPHPPLISRQGQKHRKQKRKLSFRLFVRFLEKPSWKYLTHDNSILEFWMETKGRFIFWNFLVLKARCICICHFMCQSVHCMNAIFHDLSAINAIKM